MAQWLNQVVPPHAPEYTDGMAAMGKPVSMFRRQAAMDHARDMGCTDTGKIFDVISRMADRVERDEPFEAMEIGMQMVDLTGTYRLLAVLCTAQEPAPPPPGPVYNPALGELP